MNMSVLSNPDCYEFRIKPEKKKTVGYRRYVWKNSTNHFRVDIAESDFEDIEKNCCFIKWIDTEVQYEEFEE